MGLRRSSSRRSLGVAFWLITAVCCWRSSASAAASEPRGELELIPTNSTRLAHGEFVKGVLVLLKFNDQGDAALNQGASDRQGRAWIGRIIGHDQLNVAARLGCQFQAAPDRHSKFLLLVKVGKGDAIAVPVGFVDRDLSE